MLVEGRGPLPLVVRSHIPSDYSRALLRAPGLRFWPKLRHLNLALALSGQRWLEVLRAGAPPCGNVSHRPARTLVSMSNRRPTRRHALLILGAGSVGLPLLAACSAPAPAPAAAPTPAPTSAPTSAPAAAPTASVAATPRPTAAAAAAGAAPTASIAGSASGTPVVVGGVRLPTYVPYAGAQPDSPGSPDGMIDAGYKAYPSTRPKSVTTTPGDGSDINMMTWTGGPVPPALDQNPGWQEVNRQVGANLKVNMTPFADYFGTKLQLAMASGELPDVFSIIADPAIALVPEFFNTKCADLTPYLSGDAVKEYPNLAAIPTRSWKTTVYDGKIYEIGRAS